MIYCSVIIPTSKRPQLLARCLTALHKQDVAKNIFEIIVVSDGPDQATKDMIYRIKKELHTLNIVYLETQEKKGPAAARNYGWKMAKGKLVLFTDDDTIPAKDWISNIFASYKGERYIAFTGKIVVPISARPTDYEKNIAGLETADFITANCCCTKEALKKVGGFDERFSMAWREDSDLEFKLITHGIPIHHIDHAIVVHPVREAPWGVSISDQKKGMFNALLYKKFPVFYRQRIQMSPAWNYYSIVLSTCLLLASIIAGLKTLAIITLIVWLLITISFIVKRLRHTTKRAGHIFEMIITSFCIPFISVYWQLYGAWRYRVLFF